MGFFDFFKKDNGKQLFPENAAAEARADAIRAEIKRLGLPGDITVNVEGSKVKIGGKVPDETTRRKLVVIAGNTKHIDSVDDDGVQQGTAQTGQATQSIGPDGGWNTVMASWAPKVGELVGYMMSTPARNWPGMHSTNERSNIVLQPWRDTSAGSKATAGVRR